MQGRVNGICIVQSWEYAQIWASRDPVSHAGVRHSQQQRAQRGVQQWNIALKLTLQRTLDSSGL